MSNYYTMSGKGVTHFFDGELDFLTLGGFEREYLLFSKIMRLRMFRQFRLWKAFKVVWRRLNTSYLSHIVWKLLTTSPHAP